MTTILLITALLAGAASPSVAAPGPTAVDAPPPPPRNIILMISDGCGYHHEEAASLYETGEPARQVYRRFPVQCAVSTWSLDGEPYDPARAWASFDWVRQRPTDSAAAITALGTGVKTRNGILGMDAEQEPLRSFLWEAELAGRATGVVTSVEFCHATPAGLVVADLDRGRFEPISRTMILDSPLEVIMGAGHPRRDDDGRPATEPSYRYVGGEATWLALRAGTAGADSDGDGTADPWTLVDTRAGFQALATGPVPRRVLGVAPVRHTLQEGRGGDRWAAPYAVPRLASSPTLSEMSLAALHVLARDPDGFAVMIEGGAVDWASHENESGRLIEEQVEFDQAVAAVVEWIETESSWDRTLLVVTADHECGYLLGPGSGTNPPPDATTPAAGAAARCWRPLENRGRGQLPGLAWCSRKHTSSLVPLHARGAGSERLARLALLTDPVRGRYLDDCDVGRTLRQLAGEEAAPAGPAAAAPTSAPAVGATAPAQARTPVPVPAPAR